MKEDKSFLQHAVNLGFGLLSVTREKVEKISSDLVKRGELSSKEAKKWVKEFEKYLNKEMKFLDKKVQKGVKEFVRKLKVPTRTEFDKLSREVSKLKREVSKLKTGKAVKTTRTRKKKSS
jgi:polyhydroxyalkanoate synthesis regulator phasin